MLVIIRGLPGSGKSTYAKEHFKGYYHYEADMFFMKDGSYQFDPEKIRKAHEWCQQKVESALKNGYNVVVSNTFTTKNEITPYLNMLDRHPTELKIITMNGNFGSIHNVPEKTINKMRERWEDNIFY